MGRKLRCDVEAVDIANALGLTLRYGNTVISSVSSLEEACEGSFCFAKSMDLARTARSNCLLLTSIDGGTDRVAPTIFSQSPRLDFARALEYLDNGVGFVWLSNPPEIHQSVKVGKNVVIGNGAVIGAGSVIHNNVVIGAEVIIGKDCIVKSCAVIGEEGFGFERDSDGKAVRLPHIGGVIIGNSVEIGSLTTVCRGTLGNTVICDGAKIDDHVHIAHNVHVGRDAFVIACAEVSGGVRIGDRAWIAPNASVLNQLSIGDDAVVGLGGVVVKSVASGSVVAGNPAKPLTKKSQN